MHLPERWEHHDGAVRAGMSWLDQHYPEWFDHIDLDELALENGRFCVLGQVARSIDPAGSFSSIVTNLTIEEAEDVGDTHAACILSLLGMDHGLTDDAAAAMGFDDPMGEYDILDRVWTFRLLQRATAVTP